jgi:hypothetical protein
MKDRQGIGSNFSGKLTQRLEAYTDPNCAVIDVEDCLHYLRSTYREYSRLKEGPFRVHVTRAVTAISQRRAQQQQSADVLSAQVRLCNVLAFPSCVLVHFGLDSSAQI